MNTKKSYGAFETVDLGEFVNVTKCGKGNRSNNPSRQAYVRIDKVGRNDSASLLLPRDTAKSLISIFGGVHVNLFFDPRSNRIALTAGTQRKMSTRPSAQARMYSIACTHLAPAIKKALGNHRYFYFDRGGFAKDAASGLTVFLMNFTGYEPSEA